MVRDRRHSHLYVISLWTCDLLITVGIFVRRCCCGQPTKCLRSWRTLRDSFTKPCTQCEPTSTVTATPSVYWIWQRKRYMVSLPPYNFFISINNTVLNLWAVQDQYWSWVWDRAIPYFNILWFSPINSSLNCTVSPSTMKSSVLPGVLWHLASLDGRAAPVLWPCDPRRQGKLLCYH